jgi:hypothetical protein
MQSTTLFLSGMNLYLDPLLIGLAIIVALYLYEHNLVCC